MSQRFVVRVSAGDYEDYYEKWLGFVAEDKDDVEMLFIEAFELLDKELPQYNDVKVGNHEADYRWFCYFNSKKEKLTYFAPEIYSIDEFFAIILR